MRLNTPPEFLDTLSRNWWELIRAVSGIVDLDPEQEGNVYVWKYSELWNVFYMIPFVILFFLGGWKGIVLWFLCPAFACMFFELGYPDQQGAYSGRGPRVWLSRWYLSTLAVALIVLPFPAWFRWMIVLYWALTSYRTSYFYRSELAYYSQHKLENPNRDHYRIANLPWQYLRNGQELRAAEEYAEVLKLDPDNWRANMVVKIMQSNLDWHAKGIVGLGFTCAKCGWNKQRMVLDGSQLTGVEHDAFFLKMCPVCGRRSEYSVL